VFSCYNTDVCCLLCVMRLLRLFASCFLVVLLSLFDWDRMSRDNSLGKLLSA
jgi:hypothetical protein